MVCAALTPVLTLTLTPVLALTLLLTPLSAAPAGQSGDSDEPLDRTDRVVGGTEVPPGEGGGEAWDGAVKMLTDIGAIGRGGPLRWY